MTKQMAALMGLMGLLTACGAGVGQGQQNIDSSQPASSVAVDPAQSAPSSQPATATSGAAADPVLNSATSPDAVPTSSSNSAGLQEYAVEMTDPDLRFPPVHAQPPARVRAPQQGGPRRRKLHARSKAHPAKGYHPERR